MTTTPPDARNALAEIVAGQPTLRSANIARQREWDKDSKISLSYRGNELAGEVGEACNVLKKIERERLGIAGSRATLQDLADELADVVICADLIAMQEGIDLLGEAVPAKFNATSAKVGLSTRLVPQQPTDKARIAALEAQVEGMRGLIRWAHDTLWEINPSNYDHDEVCKLNDASVEVILGLAPTLGETHGKAKEWWDARAALQSSETTGEK